jgi:hypothetical protein
MITHHYSSTGSRPLDKIKHLKIIDIGGATSFADGYLDAIVDAGEPKAKAHHNFIGNLNDPEFWSEVRAHGKWDYAICTHTLEDIINPIYVAKQIEQIAKAGLIIVPSKYRELARFAGTYRGFLHHRWIFDVINGVLTAFPKIGWIEQSRFDSVHHALAEREELIIEWEGTINLQAVNNDQPYKDNDHIIALYDQLKTNPPF